ncbi:MAG: replicative DNA helicase, partial [Acidimicrobiales bacterium]
GVDTPQPQHPELPADRSLDRTRPAIRSTREIAESLHRGDDRRPNHRIPVAAALDCPDVDLPVDPYLFGVWLANGHSGKPELTTDDAEIVGAFGAMPGPKHVPYCWLRASSKQRLALLQGIMDAAGCVAPDGTTCRISLADERLVADIRELVLSLGYKPGPALHDQSNTDAGLWTLGFAALDPVFRIAGKATAQRIVDRGSSEHRWRTIREVRPVGSVPTQCITVDSPRHLYLAGAEMVPTHNTAFALGMSANAAMKDGKPVLFFSLEMSQLELSQRILCSEALVDSSRVRTGHIEEPEWNRISHAVGRLAEAPIYIDDNPQTSVMEIRAKARRLKSRVGDLGMVVVDYIQLMSGRSNAESRQVEVSEISRGLKILARELEAPVVALAQLNRSLEQRVDKRPMLSDLRESGSLEQDADVVLFLYRDEVYDDQSPDRGVAEVIVAKHRNGPTGKTKLAFRGQYTRFDNMARSTPGGPPPSAEAPPPQDF